MRRGEHDRGRAARIERLEPAGRRTRTSGRRATARRSPTAGRGVERSLPASALNRRNAGGHDGADGVTAHVLGPGGAAAVAEEPGQRLARAGQQRPADDVHVCESGHRRHRCIVRAGSSLLGSPAAVDAFQAIVLGIVQGLTEFLPISSTAHLRIVPAFVGWEDPGAAFTAVTQLGTMAAVLLYFRADLWRIARDLAREPAPARAALRARRPDGLVHHPRHDPDRRLRARSSPTRSRAARATST